MRNRLSIFPIFRLVLAVGLVGLLGCSKSGSAGPAPLRVGMELSTPPFEMEDKQGNPDGVSVRLAEAMAEKLGRPLKIEVMAFKGLETALKTGKIDLILSSMTDTPKRRESIDFSDPYCRIGLAVLVPSASPVQSAADLAAPGRVIVARQNTTAVEFIQKNYPQAKITYLDNEAACALEIVQGKADAFIYDQLSILRFHLAQPEKTRALLEPLQREAWAIALRQGEPDLKAKVNAFLDEFRKSGGFERLGAQYFSEERAALQARGVAFIFE